MTRILRIRSVAELVGVSPSHVKRLVARGQFPPPINLGDSRICGWDLLMIEGWIKERVTDTAAQQLRKNSKIAKIAFRSSHNAPRGNEK